MLFLYAESAFKPVPLSFKGSLLKTFLKASSFIALSLRTKEMDIPYFLHDFQFALLAYMESARHILLARSWASAAYEYSLSGGLLYGNALNEMCSMNDMPSVCMLLGLAPNSTDLLFLPFTMRRI